VDLDQPENNMTDFKSDDYQEGQESQGVGDSIAKVTHFFRIHKVAEAVARIAGAAGCGCKERREFLNQLFPYKHTVRTFKVLKDINIDIDENGVPQTIYKEGEILEIKRGHPLFSGIIELQKDGGLVEM
jgi:hypothetical protein